MTQQTATLPTFFVRLHTDQVARELDPRRLDCLRIPLAAYLE